MGDYGITEEIMDEIKMFTREVKDEVNVESKNRPKEDSKEEPREEPQEEAKKTNEKGIKQEIKKKVQKPKRKIEEELLSLSKPDPEYAALFGEAPPPSGGFTDGPLEPMRASQFNLEKLIYENTSTLGTKESVGKIRMRDGYESEIRVFRPSSLPDNGSPLIVLIFGGGYLVGTNMQLAPFARALSAVYKSTTITLSYRLAPEFPWPHATHDVWDSVKWIAQHATLLGADPTKGFVLGGVSAGGHLTCITAQRAVKEKLSPPLTGLWISIPVTTVKADSLPEKYRADWLSRIHNADAPFLSVKDIECSRVHYKPDLLSEDFSPFALPDTVLHMPPAYIQVAGMDPLRDDGLIYERYLRDHGIQTRLDVYPGVPHCHFSIHPDLALSKKFRLDVPLGVGWLLRHEVDEWEVRKVAGGALGLVDAGETE